MTLTARVIEATKNARQTAYGSVYLGYLPREVAEEIYRILGTTRKPRGRDRKGISVMLGMRQWRQLCEWRDKQQEHPPVSAKEILAQMRRPDPQNKRLVLAALKKAQKRNMSLDAVFGPRGRIEAVFAPVATLVWVQAHGMAAEWERVVTKAKADTVAFGPFPDWVEDTQSIYVLHDGGSHNNVPEYYVVVLGRSVVDDPAGPQHAGLLMDPHLNVSVSGTWLPGDASLSLTEYRRGEIVETGLWDEIGINRLSALKRLIWLVTQPDAVCVPVGPSHPNTYAIEPEEVVAQQLSYQVVGAPRAGGGTAVARIKCATCDAAREIPVIGVHNPEFVGKKVRESGWDFNPFGSSSRTRCPECLEREAKARKGESPKQKEAMNGKDHGVPVLPTLPKERRARIHTLLTDHFHDGQYLDGYSDQRVGEECDVPWRAVVEMRDMLGLELVSDPDVEANRAALAALKARVDEYETLVLTATEQLQSSQPGLVDALHAAVDDLVQTGIRELSERVFSEADERRRKIDGEIVAITRRLDALAARVPARR